MYFGLGCPQSRFLNKDMGINTFLYVGEKVGQVKKLNKKLWMNMLLLGTL